jgi:hypothetical protein
MINKVASFIYKVIEFILMRIVLTIFWCLEIGETLWNKIKITNKKIDDFVKIYEINVMWSIAISFLIMCFFLIP